MRNTESELPFITHLRADDNRNTKIKAIQAVEKTKNIEAVEPLIRLLADSDEIVREKAAWSLGHFKDKRAVEPLIKLLNNKNTDLRQGAASSLGEIRNEQALEPLKNLVLDPENSEDVCKNAAMALSDFGEKGLSILLSFLESPIDELRVYAAWGLIFSRSKEALVSLARALKDKNPEVRCTAAWAIGEIKDEETADLLISALEDPEADVRCAVVNALGQIGSKQAIPYLQQIGKNDNTETSWGGIASEEANKAISMIIESDANHD